MKKVHEKLTEILPRIIELSEDIYCHPELGEGDRGLKPGRDPL